MTDTRGRTFGGHRKPPWLLLVIAAGMCLSGCASYTAKICEPLSLAHCGQFREAVASLDTTPVAGSRNDRFLYRAERAHLLHLAGDYAASNEEFERAAGIGEALAPHSITATLTDYTVNEVVREYPGEDYELAYLHYYMALNYLMLGDLKEASVECQRLDKVFRKLDQRYEDDDRYQEDAFIRFLSGLIHESLGDFDDALVDYEKAMKAYDGDCGRRTGVTRPESLVRSLLSVSKLLGCDSEISCRYGLDGSAYPPVASEVIVIVETGWVPYKEEASVRLPIYRELIPPDLRGNSNLGALVKVAYPEFHDVTWRGGRPKITVNSGGPPATASAERAHDMGRLARWSLERRLSAIKTRSAMRATGKQVLLATQKAKQKEAIRDLKKKLAEAQRNADNLLKKLAAKALEIALERAEDALTILVAETEQADTRNWVFLPSEVWIARIPVEPGEHDILVSAGAGAQTSLAAVDVPPGETVFRCCRIFGGSHPVRCESD